MVIHVDIVGIGDRKVPDNKKEMESLNEYLSIAKKFISSYASNIRYGLADEMLKNEDAVSNIAHAIMMADWQFDGRGNIFGFRKERAKYAIKSYLSRRSREFNKKVYRLDNVMDFKSSDSTFSELLEDENPEPSSIMEEKDLSNYILVKMDSMVNKGMLSDKGVRLVKLHYMDNVSMLEIAKSEGISRQAVYDIINRTLKIIRNSTQELGV